MQIRSLSADLIAVPLVLLLLLAFIVPAVLQRREQARQHQRTSQMQQLGLSLHGYHDTFQSFPATPKAQVKPTPAPKPTQNTRPRKQPQELISPL